MVEVMGSSPDGIRAWFRPRKKLWSLAGSGQTISSESGSGGLIMRGCSGRYTNVRFLLCEYLSGRTPLSQVKTQRPWVPLPVWA